MPHEIHQVGGVLPVVDCERRIEPDLFGVVAQESCSDAVKGTGPGERPAHDAGIGSKHLNAYPFHPTGHLTGSSAREGHQQNAARVCAIDDEMRDAMGERVGLARTRSGDNKKRHARCACIFPNAVFDGPPLFRIKLFEIGGRHGFRISLGTDGSINHVPCFAHNAFAAPSIQSRLRHPSSRRVTESLN